MPGRGGLYGRVGCIVFSDENDRLVNATGASRKLRTMRARKLRSGGGGTEVRRLKVLPAGNAVNVSMRVGRRNWTRRRLRFSLTFRQDGFSLHNGLSIDPFAADESNGFAPLARTQRVSLDGKDQGTFLGAETQRFIDPANDGGQSR